MVDDNTAKDTTDASKGSSTAAHRYLAQISAYRETILQISNILLDTSQFELGSNHPRLINYEKQIADVIRNLENLDSAPAGVKFKKQAVLTALNNARDELGMALLLLKASDPEKAVRGVKNITRCRGHLNLALRHMPSNKG